jgi:protein-S-isoprenylcysteine O-methyltransferase Ste14
MPSDEPSLMAPEICSLIFVLGMIIQISAKIALGRSFGVIAASRGVKVSGPYRFVRHPMYMGYFVCHIGVLSTFSSRYSLILYATAFCVQIVRLLREEHLLNDDAKYRAFAAQVRYRILPGVF